MAGRRTQRKPNSQQQRRLNILVIISGGVLILAALVMTPFFKNVLSSQREYIYPLSQARPLANGNAMGNPNAPVVIQEYSDFGCSHCRTFAFTKAEEIAAQYVTNGQVYFVFNSVGTMLGHPNSVPAIEAAYCAADQGRFWEYHDLLYANQTTLFANINRNIDRALLDFAESLSLDMARFQACLDQDTTLEQVQADQDAAYQADIFETPSFTVNGVLFQGDWTQGDLEAAIEEALAAKAP
jgi:protein-disulfide isomerase